jgi:predicted AAA+ superfamily ATPase
LAGRKKIFEMYPLDFEEFLTFKNQNTKLIQKEKWNTFLPTYYQLYKSLYEEYIQFGGFPEVVLADTAQEKTDYLKDVLNAHIELDIKLLGDLNSSDSLYKLIFLLANRVGSKIDYSKIGSLLGINRVKVKEYILLLEHTFLIKNIKPFTKGIDKEISKQEKVYFTDTGLLQICGQQSSGAIFENAIATQLSQIGEVNYYEKSSGTEIDFILKTEAIGLGISNCWYISHLLKFKEKENKILNRFHIGLELNAGIGFSRASLDFRDTELVGGSTYNYFISRDFQSQVGLKFEYDYLKSPIISSIGLKVGYQYFNTQTLKDRNGENWFVQGNTPINLNFSGVFGMLYLVIGK